MANNRFIADIQEGATTEDTVKILMQQFIQFTAQINDAKVPIVKGPTDELPEGILAGQPVIDWSSGTTVLKTWDGEKLV